MHAESATGICGLLPYPRGLMSSWSFVLGDSVLGDFVPGLLSGYRESAVIELLLFLVFVLLFLPY